VVKPYTLDAPSDEIFACGRASGVERMADLSPHGSHTGHPGGKGRFKAYLRRKSHRLVRFGWKGWLVLARRAAPWALLAFALIQIKTLSDKVRQIENREFQAMQDEVNALRKDLGHLRADVQAADRQLSETEGSLKSVNESLERAKRRVPELSHAIEDANAASIAVRAALPDPEDATALSQSMQKVDGQLTGIVASLPSPDAGARLAGSVQSATQAVGDLQAKLPDAARAAQLAAAIDGQQKRVDGLAAALPRVEQAVALTKALEANTAAATAVRNPIPSGLQKSRDAAQALGVVRAAAVPAPSTAQ
jgi:chromosome segregation ATPase